MNRRTFIKSSLISGCGICAGIACLNYGKANFFEHKSDSPFVCSKDTLPKKISIEACNLCQLDCTKCWMRKDEEKIIRLF